MSNPDSDTNMKRAPSAPLANSYSSTRRAVLVRPAYATEAVDEHAGILAQEAFAVKPIVIIVGYDKETGMLLSAHLGVASRFHDDILGKHVAGALPRDYKGEKKRRKG